MDFSENDIRQTNARVFRTARRSFLRRFASGASTAKSSATQLGSARPDFIGSDFMIQTCGALAGKAHDYSRDWALEPRGA
ncbi:MAG TPA: hypothetical protein VJ731_01690, partial [Terriglobales bacterium]|nr:hypothetical protein [Terriglobales bacterium]